MTYINDMDGGKMWYNANGVLHRDNDLPAVERIDGSKYWYTNGKLYRDNNLHVIEKANGGKEWCINNIYHRDNDLPAIITAEGDKYWFVNGKLHRLGGLPAIEYANGINQWYMYDINYAYEQVINYYKILTRFSRSCLRKIRMRRLRHLRWIHGELLCMPVKGNFPGGQDYHKMVGYFMSM
jgi:hypothetical protein